MAFNSIQQVHAYLDAIPQFRTIGKQAADFNLDRFREFCTAMNNPQDTYPTIHVAGTNGKGSTCYLLGAILSQAGYKTGVYTSPHLLRFNERFTINGQEMADEDLVTFFQQNEKLIEGHKLTYFELSTAIAFWYFAQKEVDVAVIEVGLGGRLDATNIITPRISIITNISLDHTDILGDTVSQIAREKAGIIKKDVPLIVGNMSREAMPIIEQIAKERNASLYTIEELQPRMQQDTCILHQGTQQFEFKSDWPAPVQAYNIAVAWRTVHLLAPEFEVDEKVFASALTRLKETYPNKGRFEKLTDTYDWYFDGGHNLEAVRAMKETVSKLKPVAESVVVVSLMEDKVHKELLNEFLEFKKIFYHEVDSRRAARFEYIKQLVPSIERFPQPDTPIHHYLEEFESELVIFAGSFYFYEAVRDWLTSFKQSR